MIVGGCDVGSATGKAVVMNKGTILSYVIIPCSASPVITARIVMDEAIKKTALPSWESLDYIVGTGYGRLKIPFANENVSEITCHAKGAHFLSSTVRTVVDIGGQDCKVMSISDRGRVIEFVMNDKCAAGTGRFFEAMARVLDCGLEGFSSLAGRSKNAATITSQCSVFAESEVITLLNEGIDLVDIVAGLNNSIASRLTSMVKRVGLIEDVALTGGCAKNDGLVVALEEKLGVRVIRPPQDPQIIGAIGAALIAQDRLNKQS